MPRLLTLDVRLLLGAQLLIERRKTLARPRLEAILMAEIPVVAQPLHIVWPVFPCDALLPQQGLIATGQFGGRVSMSRHPDLHILSILDDIQLQCLSKQNVIVKKRAP
jgi:hypothetical protein